MPRDIYRKVANLRPRKFVAATAETDAKLSAMDHDANEAAAVIPPEIWQRLQNELTAFASEIRTLPVVEQPGVAEVRADVEGRFDFAARMPLAEVLDHVTHLLRTYAVHVVHPRYFGLFNPSVRAAGVVADLLAAAYNPQLAAWSHAPAAAELEHLTLRALGALLGLSPGSFHATFTSGGAEANLSAVLAALAHRFPETAEAGVGALAVRGVQPVIYLTVESHHSFVKIARMTGLGTAALRHVPVTASGGMDPLALEEALRHDRASEQDAVMIVATAGTTGSGAIDPIREIGAIARAHDTWLHVDAAWGGAAAFVPELRSVLTGIESADSVTWDAHKWLSVPMGAGMFFCSHPEAVARAFAVTASYMPPAVEAGALFVDDRFDTTAEWSRRAIGLKVFMTLAELGIDGYAGQIAHQVAVGNLLRAELEKNGWIVVNSTPLPLINFTNADMQAGLYAPHDLLRALYARRRTWISEVTMSTGEKALRACITSFRTNPDDVSVLVSELELARASVEARS